MTVELLIWISIIALPSVFSLVLWKVLRDID